MRIDAELFDICKDFIKKYEITSAEGIYQNDRVQEHVTELLEEICDLIGYYDEEDEDDLDFEDD